VASSPCRPAASRAISLLSSGRQKKHRPRNAGSAREQPSLQATVIQRTVSSCMQVQGRSCHGPSSPV
jgi:hypothetical protein